MTTFPSDPLEQANKGKGKGPPVPTPEPATYGLIFVGFCVILLWIARARKRRRTKSAVTRRGPRSPFISTALERSCKPAWEDETCVRLFVALLLAVVAILIAVFYK